MNQSRRHWQQILLREWRHCEDQDYARELFALISREPVVWWAPAITYMLIGSLYGAEGGFFGWLLTCGCLKELWEDVTPYLTQRVWATMAPFVSAGIGIAGVMGLAVGLSTGLLTPWERSVRQLRAAVGGLLIGLHLKLLGSPLIVLFGVIEGIRDGGEVVAGLSNGLFVWLILVEPLGLVASLVVPVVAFFEDMRSPGRRTGFGAAYKFRFMFFWWCHRPLAAEVEAALRAIASEPWWNVLLDRLAVAKKSNRLDSASWIIKVKDANWRERFLARHALVTLGGEVVEPLRAHRDATADWLLKSIAVETAQLAPKAANLLCPRCFVRCQQHRVQLKRDAITYYGCRLCRQSVEWLEAQEVVAVLDSQMTTPWKQRDGRLYVNGLARGALFDFDRVAIVDATDDAVERFCMQVGNDTDDYRRPRYRTMQYEVGCPLTENTRRILHHTFGGA